MIIHKLRNVHRGERATIWSMRLTSPTASRIVLVLGVALGACGSPSSSEGPNDEGVGGGSAGDASSTSGGAAGSGNSAGGSMSGNGGGAGRAGASGIGGTSGKGGASAAGGAAGQAGGSS